MFKINNSWGFAGQNLLILKNALEIANTVIPNGAFDAAILSHKKLNGKPGFDQCDLTPEQVLKKYKDYFNSNPSLDFTLENPPWYKRFTSEIARETSLGPVFNARKYPCGGVIGVAGTVSHEGAHGAGLSHEWARSRQRDNSAPVRIGDIVEEIAKKAFSVAALQLAKPGIVG